MYDFDKKVERLGTNCVKWDSLAEKGMGDLSPMWVADMDFEVSPHILEEMQKVMDYKVFGYHYTSPEYSRAIIRWMALRHQYHVEKEWILYTPNVVAGLSLAVCTVSEPGDEIIIQTPVYGPFFTSITDNGRKIVENPLIEKDGYYTMDLQDLEDKITEKTKAVMLCNPHNPCGRVWTRAELGALAEICEKHDLYIISDDIHGDIVFPGSKHTVIASLSDAAAERCIICTSPSKAFNLAGMQVAHCIIKNETLRSGMAEILKKLHMNGGNAFEEAMVVGAYNQSAGWLDEAVAYIEGNIDYFVDYITRHIPELSVRKPEGTYLVWVDCRRLGLNQEALKDFFFKTCKVYLNDGQFFGSKGEGFMRFNLACPRAAIEPVLKRIEHAVKNGELKHG